jgi:hypothetical protein
MKLSDAELDSVKAYLDSGKAIREYLSDHSMATDRPTILQIREDLVKKFGREEIRRSQGKITSTVWRRRIPVMTERFMTMIQYLEAETLQDLEDSYNQLLAKIAERKQELGQ